MLKDQTGFHLKSKADAEDEGGDRGDEPREERIEGEGAHLVNSSLKILQTLCEKMFAFMNPTKQQ